MTDDGTPTIDAVEDYVTCPRCRVMRSAVVGACPRCELDAVLTIERYRPSPTVDPTARARMVAAIADKHNALEAERRRKALEAGNE